MKIEYKQSFYEDEKEFKVKYKDKPVQAEVPAYFLVLATFLTMLKAGLIKVLSFEENEFSDIPEKYKKISENLSEEDEAFIHSVIDAATVQEEESEEDEGEEDDKEPSTSSDSVDSDSQSSTESAPAGETTPASDEVKKSEEEEIEAEKLQAEYAALHEKAKRLNKTEKARYEELKTKLKIEG